MKKLFAALVALLPAIYAAAMSVSFFLSAGDGLLFGILAAFAIMGLLFPLFFCVITTKANSKFLAVSNVCFYAGNLLLFLSEVVLWIVRYQENVIAEQNGGMEGGLGLALLIIVFLPHWVSYLFTRIAGAISCARSLNGVCSQRVKMLHAVLQLFPIADLISAVWVLWKANRTLSLQQSTVENE